MDSLIDKVRSVFEGSGKGSYLDLVSDGARAYARACVNCDRLFGPSLPRFQCTVCDRIVCSKCSSHGIPQQQQQHSATWGRSPAAAAAAVQESQCLRVCDFCYHMREPLLSESMPAHGQVPPMRCVEHAQWVARAKSASAPSGSWGSVRPQDTGLQLPAVTTPPITAREARNSVQDAQGLQSSQTLSRRDAARAREELCQPLTWELPPVISTHFGLYAADREQLSAMQAQQDAAGFAPAADALPAEVTNGHVRQAGAGRARRNSVTTGDLLAGGPSLEAAGCASGMSLHSELQGIFAAASEQHLQRLAAQLLYSEGVGAQQVTVWAPLVTRLAVGAVLQIDPAQHLQAPVRAGVGEETSRFSSSLLSMRVKYPDPCDRIKVKKLVDVGNPANSNVVPGVVCKRNLARKNMPAVIDRPCSVLLIAGNIDATQGKGASQLATFENMKYEQDNAKLAEEVVRKLQARGVELLVVEKLVAGKVTEALAANRIALVHNVHVGMLQRLAHCLDCTVDRWDLVTDRSVGLCRSFRVDPAGLAHTKTPGSISACAPTSPTASAAANMADDLFGTAGGAPQVSAGGAASFTSTGPGSRQSAGNSVCPTLAHLVGARSLAATILLRGGSEEQLVRVKRVTKFLVLAAWHARIECSFLATEMAVALASVDVEMPHHAGGLNAYKQMVADCVAASVECSATYMPYPSHQQRAALVPATSGPAQQGLLTLTLSPHVNMWDSSLAAEYEETLNVLVPPLPPPTLQPAPAMAFDAGATGFPAAPGTQQQNGDCALLAQQQAPLIVLSPSTSRNSNNAGGAQNNPQQANVTITAAADALASHTYAVGSASLHERSSTSTCAVVFNSAGNTAVQPQVTRTTSAGSAFAAGQAYILGANAGLAAAFEPAPLSPTAQQQQQQSLSPGVTSQPPQALLRAYRSIIGGDMDGAQDDEEDGLSASARAALQVAAGRSILPGMSSMAVSQASGPGSVDAGMGHSQHQGSGHVPSIPPSPSIRHPLTTASRQTSGLTDQHFSDPLRSSMDGPSTPPHPPLPRCLSRNTSGPLSMGINGQQGQPQLQANGQLDMQPGLAAPQSPQYQQQQQQWGWSAEVLAAEEAALTDFRAAHGWKVKELMSFSMSTCLRYRHRSVMCDPFKATMVTLYGDGDMPLKDWLQSIQQRWCGPCQAPDCGEALEQHYRYFLHGNARITVSWTLLPEHAALPNLQGPQGPPTVWMWLRPRHISKEAERDIARVALPPEAAALSWAGLMQLLLKGNNLRVGARGERCLHQHFVHYFGMGRLLVCMYPDAIKLHSVLLPDTHCMYNPWAQISWLTHEVSDLREHAHNAFGTIERLLMGNGQATDTSQAGAGPDLEGPSPPGASTPTSLTSFTTTTTTGVTLGTASGTTQAAGGERDRTASGTGGLLSAALQSLEAGSMAPSASMQQQELRSSWLPSVHLDQDSLREKLLKIQRSVLLVPPPAVHSPGSSLVLSPSAQAANGTSPLQRSPSMSAAMVSRQELAQESISLNPGVHLSNAHSCTLAFLPALHADAAQQPPAAAGPAEPSAAQTANGSDSPPRPLISLRREGEATLARAFGSGMLAALGGQDSEAQLNAVGNAGSAVVHDNAATRSDSDSGARKGLTHMFAAPSFKSLDVRSMGILQPPEQASSAAATGDEAAAGAGRTRVSWSSQLNSGSEQQPVHAESQLQVNSMRASWPFSALCGWNQEPVPVGLCELVDAQREVSRAKRELAYTILAWASKLQDNSTFTKECANSMLSNRTSMDMILAASGLGSAYTSNAGFSDAWPASERPSGSYAHANSRHPLDDTASERTVSIPGGLTAHSSIAGLSLAYGSNAPAPITRSNPPGLPPPAPPPPPPPQFVEPDNGLGRGLAVPIVPGTGPVAVAAVAELVVRSVTSGAVSIPGSTSAGGSLQGDFSKGCQSPCGGALLQGSASLLARTTGQALAHSATSPPTTTHSRRASYYGDVNSTHVSPGKGTTTLQQLAMAGQSVARPGAVTPMAQASPTPSELGDDDDEEGEDDDDDDDVTGLAAYSWLGNTGHDEDHGAVDGADDEEDEEDETVFYQQATPGAWQSEAGTATSSSHAARTSGTLNSAFMGSDAQALSLRIAGQQGHGAADRNVHFAEPMLQKRQSTPAPDSPSAVTAGNVSGGVGLKDAGNGTVRLSMTAKSFSGGTGMQAIAAAVAKEYEGSGEPASAPAPLKRAPTMRAIQGMARRIGNLVGPNNSGAVGKLYLPCRAILPDTPCDALCPIYDQEPTSIIAYSLSSKFYQQHLNSAFKSLLQGLKGKEAGLHSAASWTMAGGGLGPSISHLTLGSHQAQALLTAAASSPSVLNKQPSLSRGPSMLGMSPQQSQQQHMLGSGVGSRPRGVVPNGMQLTAADWSALLCSAEPYHITHAFEDTAQATPWMKAKFQVITYFAPQFAELRRELVQGGESAFVTSMSRCFVWEQRGGKSNAYFAKTKDDRYIVKSMSKAEKASFMTFAPEYFRHITRRYQAGQPSCLAKIFGAFSVTYKLLAGGPGSKEVTLDLMVMENTFYGRTISRIYDLKGSERNRYNPRADANPQDKREVHLDDNLRSHLLHTPLFIQPASHAHLLDTLWEDTHFLAKLDIMDYSLLVGIDRVSGVMTMAIIDYIRQYTLDKKMETWVKGSGILGGNGKEPTIISPRDYRIRFRRAVLSYFTRVPGSAPLRDLPLPDDDN